MLRLVALLLLLANAGYFAWSQGHLRPLGWGPVEQREPERLQQQVAADQLQVIPPKGSAPADAPAPPPAPAKPDTPDTAPTAATGPTSCQQVAGLSTAQADALQAALAGMGLDGSRWTHDESVLPERWIVYIGKFPSADLLSRKKTELRALRVEFRDVNAPALQPGLALGTYSAEAAAQTEALDEADGEAWAAAGGGCWGRAGVGGGGSQVKGGQGLVRPPQQPGGTADHRDRKGA